MPSHPFTHALRALPAALALIGLTPQTVGAAVHVWTGAGSSANWSEAANWTGGLPVSGGELLLDSAARPTSFNDLTGGFTLLGLTLGANAPAPGLSGNTLRFEGADAYLRMLSNAGHGTVSNDLVLSSALQVTGGPGISSQLFLTGNISGTGGFTAFGGRVVLSGNNSFTGATTVANGAALGVAGGALALTSGIQVARGGELQIVNSNVATALAAPIALGGTLSSSAGFVQTILGPVPGGTVNSAVTLTDTATIAAIGGTQARPVRMVVNGSVDRAGQALTLATGGATNTLAVWTLTGNGALTLRPSGGTVTTGAVAGTGELLATGNGGQATVASLAGDGRVLVDFAPNSFGELLISGSLSGSHDLDVRSGSLVLGSNTALTFSGQVTLHNGGSLSIARESMLGSASPVLQFEGGGRLLLRNGFGLSRAIVTTGGRGLVELGNNSNTINSNISGDGGIGFIGRAIRLRGTNTFAGGLAVLNDGSVNANGAPNVTQLSFDSDSNLGQEGGAILLQGGLQIPAAYELRRPLTVAGTLATVTSSGTHTISSDIDGDGRLNLSGAATILLTGNNTHTGGVALAGFGAGLGTVLVIDSDARLGAAGGVLNIGRANGLTRLPGTLRAAANLDIAATRSTSFRDMTVDTQHFDVVFNQPISGLGMTKLGRGTWTLNTANTDSSNENLVTLREGRLVLGVDQALGARASVGVIDGAVLSLNGHSQWLGSLNGSNVELGAGGSLGVLFGALEGTITGQGTITVGRDGFSPGDFVIGQASSFIGSVTVTNGSRLSVGHADSLGAPGNLLRLDNGILQAQERLQVPLVISNTTNLEIGPGGAGFQAGGQSIVIERTLSGPLKLTVLGGSVPGETPKHDVRLTNAANSFTGDLLLGDPRGVGTSVLGITADGSLGAANNRVVLGKSFFDGETTRSAKGGLRAWDSLTLAASRTVLLDGESGDITGFIDTNGHTVVVAGAIGELTSGLGLLKTGAGTLVLNGVQAYSGLTRVDEGALGGHGEVQRLSVQAATLAPGESAGLFSVRQDLSFSSGALLAMELGGLTRGSAYDGLNVGGSVDLGFDTELRLSFIGGFTATGVDQFQLIQAGGGLFGQFANVADGERLLTTDGSGSFLVHYGNGQGLVLSDFQAAAVPEPGSWALMAAGLIGLAACRRRNVHPSLSH